MPITHQYTILCDEVRREDNGKLLVVGMYRIRQANHTYLSGECV